MKKRNKITKKVKRRGGGNTPSAISESESGIEMVNSKKMKLRKLIDEVKDIIKFKFEMDENMINENVKNMTDEEFEKYLLEKEIYDKELKKDRKLTDEEKGDYRTFRKEGTLLDTASSHGLRELYDELKELLDTNPDKGGKKRKTRKTRKSKKRRKRGSGLTLSRQRVYSRDFFYNRYLPGERLTIKTNDNNSYSGEITNINQNNLIIKVSGNSLVTIPYDEIIDLELDMYKKL